MSTAIIVSLRDEEKNIEALIKSILRQTKLPDEIILVDDGSIDKTGDIIKKICADNQMIKYLYQTNRGPAAGRNTGWKIAKADICIFTDGDCIPETNWVEELLEPFCHDSIGASAGSYKTINTYSALARFVGMEISWRYRKNEKEIEVHGSYNLAIRRSILQELGGFNEQYWVPSGEDWDLTYRISRKYKIIFVPKAIVGHYHPEKFWFYFKNQFRRGLDRAKIYKDHPGLTRGDNYSGKMAKYEVLTAGLFITSLIFIFPFFHYSFLISAVFFLLLIAFSFLTFPFFAKKDLKIAFFSIPIKFIRNFSWLAGFLTGALKYWL